MQAEEGGPLTHSATEDLAFGKGSPIDTNKKGSSREVGDEGFVGKSLLIHKEKQKMKLFLNGGSLHLGGVARRVEKFHLPLLVALGCST